MSEQYFGVGGGEVDTINILEIRLPLYNFRTHNDNNIQNMVDSIRQHGLLQPIVVRTTIDDYFEVVTGYTRYLACKYLKWKKIPCHIVHLDNMQTFELALVENIQRESLSPLEEANAFKMYISDKGWGSISELASKIEKSPRYITKRIALLELPSDVQKSIENSSLKPSSAEELLSIKDPKEQSKLGELIVKRHLSTMKTRNIVKKTIIIALIQRLLK